MEDMEVDEETKTPVSLGSTCVYTWGLGKGGILGNECEDTEFLPYNVKTLNKKNIIQVKSGSQYCAVVTSDGSLYVWGNNSKGRLGISSTTTTLETIVSPQKVNIKQKCIQVSCGYWHTLAIFEAGCYSVGHNKQGALGLGDTNDCSEFTKISSLKNITRICAGRGYSLFLDSDGVLYSCGRDGVNGHKNKGNVLTPTKIKAISNVVEIDAGLEHAAAVTSDGKLYTWGSNDYMQLGQSKSRKKDDLNVPMIVSKLEDVKIVSVSCSKGLKHCQTACVDSDGNAYLWGCGYKGKLGNTEDWNHKENSDEPYPFKLKFDKKIVKVESGGIHSSIIDEDGYLH